LGKALKKNVGSSLMLKYELLEPIVYSLGEINRAYELEDQPKIFKRIDNIVIKDKEKEFQFGEICYLSFKKKRTNSVGTICKLSVIIDSLAPERVVISKILLEYINDLFMDGLRDITIFGRIKKIHTFIKYLHTNNIKFQLEKKSIQTALIHYSEYLQHRIKIYDKELKIGLTKGTAHNYQNWVLTFCAYILKTDILALLDAHYIIVSSNNERVKTQVLSNENCGVQFSQYTSIFRRFSSIVLDHETFPLSFDLVKETYWVTHLGKIIHSSGDILYKSGVFNFNEGRNYTKDEITSCKRYKNQSEINEAIKIQRQQKEKSNTYYSSPRLFLAIYACKSYFMHFLFITGENDSTAANILFNENYTVENSYANFKSIKWRANGRTVKYDIQSEFIHDFKIYLRLRNYLLKHYNEMHRTLFLDIRNKKLTIPNSSGSHSSYIRQYFSSVFSKNNFDSPSKRIRVTKGLWIRNNYGGSLSSYILQHSDKASNASYTSSNYEKSSEELTHYFSELTNQLLDSPGIEKSTPSGNCVEPNTPQALSDTSSLNVLTIDCGDQKSCFFCSKYRVHGDEIDIRKLLSIKYIINQTEHLAASIEHFNNTYTLVLTHIDALLSKIRLLGEEQAELIINIHQQVFEQEKLSDYWYRKLELLDELGVL
jgi:hypothetical protein